MSKFNVDFAQVDSCFGKAEQIAGEIERLGKMVNAVRGDMRDALVGFEGLGTAVSNLGTQISNRVQKLTEFSDIGKKIMKLYEMTEADNLMRIMQNDPTAVFGGNSLMGGLGGVGSLGTLFQLYQNPSAILGQLSGWKDVKKSWYTPPEFKTTTVLNNVGTDFSITGEVQAGEGVVGEIGKVKNTVSLVQEGPESRLTTDVDNAAAKVLTTWNLGTDKEGNSHKIVVTMRKSEFSGAYNGSAVNEGKNVTRFKAGYSKNWGAMDIQYLRTAPDGSTVKAGVIPQLGTGAVYGAGQDSKGGEIFVTHGPVSAYWEYTNSEEQAAQYLRQQTQREALNNKIQASQQTSSGAPTINSSLFNAMDNDRL